jgi:uncharacterized protein YjbI with pentapeptide repeats
MANNEHFERLLQGSDVWNEWRTLHPEVDIDLRGADLRGATLSGADLSDANLTKALQLHFLGDRLL